MSTEAVRPAIESEITFNEAPASANLRMRSPDGVVVQFTIRDAKLSTVFERVNLAIEYLSKQGWKPADGVVAKPAATPDGEVKMCPIHNVPMEKREGKYGAYWSHKVEETPAFPKGWCNGKVKS